MEGIEGAIVSRPIANGQILDGARVRWAMLRMRNLGHNPHGIFTD